MDSATIARHTWELKNNIVANTEGAVLESSSSDAIVYYDEAAQAQVKSQQEKPWAKDPHHFKRVKIIDPHHSHPGYGCWLSGIDVSRRRLTRNSRSPFCRTFPEGYKPSDEPVSEYQTIPLNKIEDFGVHCKQYYSLKRLLVENHLVRTFYTDNQPHFPTCDCSSSTFLTRTTNPISLL